VAKVKELEGHSARVLLLMACSPDGETVVSAAAGETLQFWNVFSDTTKSVSAKQNSEVKFRNKKLSKTMHIR